MVQTTSAAKEVTITTGGPYIMTQPGNQTVTEGQRLIFPCGTEGYPSTISHTWLKDTVDIRTSDGFKAGRININSDGSLIIKTAVKTDKGWYMCRASNGLGHDEASAYLNVIYKPVVLPLPTQLIWAKGYRQQIDCPVDSNPPLLHVIWVKDQSQVQSKGRNDVLSNGTLLVSDVMDVDAGSYRCTPENAMGQGLSSSRVQVVVRDPPQITVSPQLLYIRTLGESVLMNCEATGTPAVSMLWIKVGGKLDDSTGRITKTDKYLEIKNLTKEDHGKYECRAINNIATVVTVTELRIDNTTPHAPFNVTVVPGIFNVTISWQPAYDGGTPQVYVLWFRQASQFDWSTMAVPSQAATYFNLYGLQPDTEYEFKLLSRNEIGNGSFSDVVRQRTLGYSPDAVNALPTDKDGVPYYPEITIKLGPEPAAPVDLTARVRDRNIYLTWRRPLSSAVPIFSYKIEYQHDGKWQYYGDRIKENTTNTATMYDMSTGMYDIYLRSYGTLSYSPWSNVARVHIPGDDVVIPQAMVGGIIGGVLFLLVAILLALVAVFYSRRKERKAKEKKYDDVNYGKPDEMNGRHHESTPKRDRWQHNGGGNLVTSLNNRDSIFFLPQTLDQSASMTRPSLLLDTNDRSHLYGRGVAVGKGYHPDFGRLVPLTNEQNYLSDRSQLESPRPKPGSNQLDVGSLTWPKQHGSRFEQQPLSRPEQPRYGHIPHSYSPSHDDLHPQDYLQHSSFSQNHPYLLFSHSDPSRHQNKVDEFSPVITQHPSHSKQMPSSSSSKYPPLQTVFVTTQPSSPVDTHFLPAARDSHRLQQHPHSSEYPSFQSEDDDVFEGIPQPPHHHVPGFPRQSSMKPSQKTYLDGSSGGHQSDLLLGLEDISSVLGPSEQASQVQASNFWDTAQSTHPTSRAMFENNADIPGYYISTGDNAKPYAMVMPSQDKMASPRHDTIQGSRWPPGYPSEHPHEETDQVPETARRHPQGDTQARSHSQGDTQATSHSQGDTQATSHSQEPPLRSPRKSNSSDSFLQNQSHLFGYASHSKSSSPVNYKASYSKDKLEDSLQHRQAPYTISEFFNEPYYYNELPRPRASSEGRLRMNHSLDPDHHSPDHGISGATRPPFNSASYPDMSLPRHERPGMDMDVRDQHQPYKHSRDHPYQNVDTFMDHPHSHLYHLHQQTLTLSLNRHKVTAPFLPESPEVPVAGLQRFTPRNEHQNPFTAPRQRHLGYHGDQAYRHSAGDVIPSDSVSHSSGIGSRNTSHSTSSYHANRQAGGKGSASFSSGHGQDLSLDISSSHGMGQPHHIRDISGDENYEFDSLKALEDDIMDDLRRYSQLSAGSTNYAAQQDSPPSGSNKYLDSERRFEKLREEFKQYRQQQYYPSDGLFQMPPTATSALPIGLNGEPLYPMDSEML
ncbi:hypothetical protein BsWGS_17465 [Bradybaena similaris]